MDCTGCGVATAESVRVEYVDGRDETLPLCEACCTDFTEGGLVRDVEPLEAN